VHAETHQNSKIASFQRFTKNECVRAMLFRLEQICTCSACSSYAPYRYTLKVSVVRCLAVPLGAGMVGAGHDLEVDIGAWWLRAPRRALDRLM
jgi:hypothetical protein